MCLTDKYFFNLFKNNICASLMNIIAVSHVIKSRALINEKPCINKDIHALLMHSYAIFNMIVPWPQACCRYEMCTAWP